MAALLSDPTLVRRLAGAGFRRADTVRAERGSDTDHALERFLVNLRGWLPPQTERAAAIRALAAEIERQTLPLRGLDDAGIGARFAQGLLGLKSARRPLGDAPALAAVLACVGEASRRRLGLSPHPVQFAAARCLMGGWLAEMRTGEGKTLVAAIAATVLAGSGALVHVISTNDYLARRDCEEMSALFGFFGLSAGFIQGGMSPLQRQAAYANAICYVSGKELVFDYLKDHLQGHGALPSRVQELRALWALRDGVAAAAQPLLPALHVALVDEADSVLIDEARTPMILARQAGGFHEAAVLQWAVQAAQGLQPGRDYAIRPGRKLDLLAGALARCPALPADVRPVWRSGVWAEQLLQQALTAIHLFLRDQHYILADGKVQIVDESTGRVMPDRSWEQGLHQLIETKEGVPITAGRETMARMTFQRFFRRYFLVAGLTGTAIEASRELWQVYRLRVRRLPPNRPLARHAAPGLCLPTRLAKWQAVAADVAAAAARGQPVLIGTRSVEASEQVAAELLRCGLPHVVLNARQDAAEAAVVARAGRAGHITVATNMAGRGTDIKLDAAAKAAGGLHVVLTEYHESPRVDRQLFGRSGRQGEPGSVRAIVCWQDALFQDLHPALRRGLAAWPPRAAAVAMQLVRVWAQWLAERRAYRTRMQTLRQDRELNRLIGFAGPQR